MTFQYSIFHFWCTTFKYSAMIELDVDDEKPSKRYFSMTKSPGVVNVKLTPTRVRTQDDLSVLALHFVYSTFTSYTWKFRSKYFDNVNSLVFYNILLVPSIMYQHETIYYNIQMYFVIYFCYIHEIQIQGYSFLANFIQNDISKISHYLKINTY